MNIGQTLLAVGYTLVEPEVIWDLYWGLLDVREPKHILNTYLLSINAMTWYFPLLLFLSAIMQSPESTLLPSPTVNRWAEIRQHCWKYVKKQRITWAAYCAVSIVPRTIFEYMGILKTLWLQISTQQDHVSRWQWTKMAACKSWSHNFTIFQVSAKL